MGLEVRLPRHLREATFPDDAHLFWELIEELTTLTRAAKIEGWASGIKDRTAQEIEGIIDELTGLLRQKYAEDFLPKVEGRKISDLGEVTLENWQLQVREAMKIILSRLGTRDGQKVTVAYSDAIRLHQLLADVIGIRFYLATVEYGVGEDNGTPMMRKNMEHLVKLAYVHNGRRNDRVTQMFDRLLGMTKSGESNISRIAAEVPPGRTRHPQIYYGFASPAGEARGGEVRVTIEHLKTVGFDPEWLTEFQQLVKTSDNLLPFQLPKWTWKTLEILRPDEYQRQRDLETASLKA